MQTSLRPRYSPSLSLTTDETQKQNVTERGVTTPLNVRDAFPTGRTYKSEQDHHLKRCSTTVARKRSHQLLQFEVSVNVYRNKGGTCITRSAPSDTYVSGGSTLALAPTSEPIARQPKTKLPKMGQQANVSHLMGIGLLNGPFARPKRPSVNVRGFHHCPDGIWTTFYSSRAVLLSRRRHTEIYNR